MGCSPHGQSGNCHTTIDADEATIGRARASMKPITILLADDNEDYRASLRALLELEADLQVVGEAKNGRQAVALVKKLRPAIVLMDVGMPLVNGLQATREILQAVPATIVLMLSVQTDDAYVEAANNAGAMGDLLKRTAANCVCRALRAVHQGKTFYSPAIPRRLHKRIGKKLNRPLAVT
jgi:DNA-binding NarL/FixJ family response regulator